MLTEESIFFLPSAPTDLVTLDLDGILGDGHDQPGHLGDRV